MKYFLNYSLKNEVSSIEVTHHDTICLVNDTLVKSGTIEARTGALSLFRLTRDGGVTLCSDISTRDSQTIDVDDTLSFSETYYHASGVKFRIDSIPDIPICFGKASNEVELKRRQAIAFGVGQSADVVLDYSVEANSISFTLQPVDSIGWKLVRSTESQGIEILKNGHPHGFDEALVYGDIIDCIGYSFEYQVKYLRRIEPTKGVWLDAFDLNKVINNDFKILDSASLQISPGGFYGVLGGSGQGKSTLLNALSGSSLPTSGIIILDGEPVVAKLDNDPGSVGYVPQDDIVHRELTVKDALLYSARLRLPSFIPRSELCRKIDRILSELGLSEHANKEVGKLSGGQRKRVSIASELLSRPSILFLDEPTSGLDPATEQDVMGLLYYIASVKCPVVCTTHILGESYLFKEIVFVNRARIVFRGSAQEACEFFGVKSLVEVYRLLADQAERKENVGIFPEVKPRELAKPNEITISRAASGPGRISSFLSLLSRQWAIFKSRPMDVLLLIGQALALGLIIGWGVENIVQRTFLLILTSVWFGCSNASQTIVKELEVLRRELLAGLNIHSYLLSKTSFWTVLTFVQVSVFWLVTQSAVALFGKNNGASEKLLEILTEYHPQTSEIFLSLCAKVAWFTEIGEHIDSYKHPELLSTIFIVLALKLGTIWVGSLVGVSIGLSISSSVKSIVMAVMMVPMLILPQIPLSGSMIPRPEMSSFLRLMSMATPCGALKQIGDAAEIYGMERPRVLNFTDRPVYLREKDSSLKLDRELRETDYEIHPMNNAWENHVTEPEPTLPHEKIIRKSLDGLEMSDQLKLEENLEKNSVYEVFADNRSDVRLRKGQFFLPTSYELWGFSFVKCFALLSVWVIVSYIISMLFIKRTKHL